VILDGDVSQFSEADADAPMAELHRAWQADMQQSDERDMP